MLQRIADRAMQVFGAMGGSDDTPIHQALAWGRLLRIGDGPDEVHLRQIFRMEAMPSWSIADSPYLAAHPQMIPLPRLISQRRRTIMTQTAASEVPRKCRKKPPPR